MEDPHPHDLYFSLPDLVDEPYPEEVYLSWSDLVGKPDPEEVHFSWEDIMSDLYSKQSSPFQTHDPTNLTSFNHGSYKSSANSDAGDSRWDDTESYLSLETSSTTRSYSTNNSKLAHGTAENDIEKDESTLPTLVPADQHSVEMGVSLSLPSFSLDYIGSSMRSYRNEIAFSDYTTVEAIQDIREQTKSIMQNGVEEIMLELDVESEKASTDAIDPMTMAIVDQVMDEFWVIFNQGWSSNFVQHATDSSETSDSPSAGDSIRKDSQQPPRRKRQRENEETGDQNGDRNSKPPRKRSSASKDSDESIKFACPFRKHDPRKYNIYSHRTCTLSHWDSIARLKEHLYRCHPFEIHCNRCWQTFQNQQQLDAHIRVASANICPLIPGLAPDGITPEQEKRLRSRKKSHPGQTDESRWTDIYKLLFPNEEVPSPYFECLHDEPPLSPNSRYLSNCEEYMRRELPLMVRGEIEYAVRQEMQPYRDSLIGNLVNIIQDCQDRAFRAYREGLDASDLCLPPGIEVAEPQPPQRQDESDFLDAVFNPPPPIQDTGGFLETLDMHDDASLFPDSDHVFSDSGYASELLCNCHGSSSCFPASIDLLSDWCIDKYGEIGEIPVADREQILDISSGV